eukprot:4917140-Lingulodinium_polyedra.AAC.1
MAGGRAQLTRAARSRHTPAGAGRPGQDRQRWRWAGWAMRPVTAAPAHDIPPRTKNPRGAPACGSSTGAPPTGAICAL